MAPGESHPPKPQQPVLRSRPPLTEPLRPLPTSKGFANLLRPLAHPTPAWGGAVSRGGRPSEGSALWPSATLSFTATAFFLWLCFGRRRRRGGSRTLVRPIWAMAYVSGDSRGLSTAYAPPRRSSELAAADPALQVGCAVWLTQLSQAGTLSRRKGRGWWEVELQDGTTAATRTGQFRLLDGLPEEPEEDVGDEAELVASSPPTITVRAAPAQHRHTRRWVVFSDLHVNSSTAPTCLAVLREVHAAALRRNAGIIFLGDFWHTRGALRVEILNQILEELAQWTVPVVLLPGNHDQVTLGGETHGISCLGYALGAFPQQGVVIDAPALFLGCLFVPHTRNDADLVAILQSQEAADCEALFVHASVSGAVMNDLVVCRSLVVPQHFPAGKPVYSGHYHQPHRVAGVVRYVGSPYQTSLSEAGQAKRLLVLDRQRGWACVEEVPLELGQCYFRPKSVQELEDLLSRMERPEDFARYEVPQAGDRVVASLPYSEEPAAVMELRNCGVSVEVRDYEMSSEAIEQELPDGLELSATETFRQYVKDVEVRRQARVMEKGERLLQELEAAEGAQRGSLSAGAAEVSRLQFISLRLANFGSYEDEVKYPLGGRGLVLIKGAAEDSNGAGKSTLAVAAYWALTGQTDTRLAADRKASDVVFDTPGATAQRSAAVASVELRGRINGLPFTILRKKPLRGAQSLRFVVDGSDLSHQTARDTQAVIDQQLGLTPGLLERTSFFFQHDMGGLLAATDGALKDELSLLVSLDVYQAAATLARKRVREAEKSANAAEVMAGMRLADGQKIQQEAEQWAARLAAATQAAADAGEELRALDGQLAQWAEAEPVEALRQYITPLLSLPAEELQGAVSAAAAAAQAAEAAAQRGRLAEAAAAERLTELRLAAGQAEARHRECRRLCDREAAAEERSRQRLVIAQADCEASARLMAETAAAPQEPSAAALPDRCPTCAQPLPHDSAVQSRATHVRCSVAATHQQAEERVRHAAQEHQQAVLAVQAAHEDAHRAADQLAAMRSAVEEAQRAVSEVQGMAAGDAALLRAQAGAAQELHARRLATAAARSRVTATQEMLTLTTAQHAQAARSAAALEEETANLQRQAQQLQREAEDWGTVADLMGPTGVQNVVLNNAVLALQRCTAKYLEAISGGDLMLDFHWEAGENGDRIVRRAHVVTGTGGADGRPDVVERSLASLSGGQWRRCALALNLGFAELCARRGRLQSSLMVLDEPLTHLDPAGRARVGQLLQSLLSRNAPADAPGHASHLRDTIIVILQGIAAEEMNAIFERVDLVQRRDGRSTVTVDGWP